MTHSVRLAEPDGTLVLFIVTLNFYADGEPCEVFTKATHGFQGWCDCVCRLFSLLLQHGVPVEAICRQLERAHFSPCGMVPGFGFARSFPDYLARWIEKEVSRLREEATARQASGGCRVSATDGTDATVGAVDARLREDASAFAGPTADKPAWRPRSGAPEGAARGNEEARLREDASAFAGPTADKPPRRPRSGAPEGAARAEGGHE